MSKWADFWNGFLGNDKTAERQDMMAENEKNRYWNDVKDQLEANTTIELAEKQNQAIMTIGIVLVLIILIKTLET